MGYKEIVKKGYNSLKEEYQNKYAKNKNTIRALNMFFQFCKTPGKIIDLGIGTGIPVAKYLNEKGFQVTGVDISEEMLKLAEKNVPSLKTVCEDFSKLSAKDEEFDAGIALFSLLHITKKDMGGVLIEINRVLKKQGYFLFCVNKGNFEGYSKLLGQKMFFACFEEKEIDEYLKNSGFEIVFKYFDKFPIGEEVEYQMYYLVRKI